LQRIDASELSFTVSDPEMLTKDSQRVGVTAQGIVPAGTNPTVVLGNGTQQQTVVQSPPTR
jgi:hypothetical protein